MAVTLRPYQHDAIKAALSSVHNGLRRIMWHMATGTGKTVTFAHLIQALQPWFNTLPPRQRNKVLVIAHREELLDQAAEKIQAANPKLMISIEQADRHANRYSDVVIASIQTLSRNQCARLKNLMSWHMFSLVITDEAHHAAADSYRTVFVHLGFLPPEDASDVENFDAPKFEDVAVMERALREWDTKAPKDRILLGVTATPNRADAIGLGCVFQSIAYSFGLKAAIKAGYLVPIRAWAIETSESLAEVRMSRGDFNQGQLAEKVNTAARNRLAVTSKRDLAPGVSTLAFTVTVDHAHALAEAFRAEGISAQALSGETPKDERRAMLAAFQRGELEVIANCAVLTEGTDLPRCGCILHAKPTRSATLYEQMSGRGLRLFPGKTECVLIDLVDITSRNSLQTAPALYGLPPGLEAAGKTLTDVDKGLEELLAEYPNLDVEKELAGGATLAELAARAKRVDVWTIQSLGELAKMLTMNWIKVRDNVFRLQYPMGSTVTETLQVEPNLLGQYDVVLTSRIHGREDLTTQRTIAAGLASDREALATAETFVATNRGEVVRLKRKEAGWRKNPASEGQLKYLRKLRVPIKPHLTSGEASDLIDLARARGGK